MRRSQSEPKRNDPCWCGSELKFKHCHLRELKVFIYQHPAMPEDWDTKAYDVTHAKRSFRAAWNGRIGPGGPLYHFEKFAWVFFEGMVGENANKDALLCPDEGCDGTDFEVTQLAISGPVDVNRAICKKCAWSGDRQQALDAARQPAWIGTKLNVVTEGGEYSELETLELEDWEENWEAKKELLRLAGEPCYLAPPPPGITR